MTTNSNFQTIESVSMSTKNKNNTEVIHIENNSNLDAIEENIDETTHSNNDKNQPKLKTTSSSTRIGRIKTSFINVFKAIYNYLKRSSASDRVKFVLFLGIIALFIIIGVVIDDPVGRLSSVVEYLNDHKNNPEIVFSLWATYIFAVVVPVPIKTVLAYLYGYFYGFAKGYLLMFSSAYIGCVISFSIARFFGCQRYVDRVTRQIESEVHDMEDNSKNNISTWDILKHMLMEDTPTDKNNIHVQWYDKCPIFSKTFWSVLVLVLSPLPMEWLNYIVGVSHVNWRSFLGAVFIGRFTAKSGLYVYIGSQTKDLDEIIKGKVGASFWVTTGLTVGLLLLAIILGKVVYDHTKKNLEKKINSERTMKSNNKNENENNHPAPQVTSSENLEVDIDRDDIILT